MKIQVLSDIHNEFGEIGDIPAKGDVLVLAGDIDCICDVDWFAVQCYNFEQVFFVCGNHEFYHNHYENVIESFRKLEKEIDNFQFLNDDYFDYKGYRFIGGTLWTDLQDFYAAKHVARAMNDYRLIKYNKKKITTSITTSLHFTTVSFIEENLADKNNIVITHHMPTTKATPARFRSDTQMNKGFSSNCEDMMSEKIKLWIFGHTHDNYEGMINGTQLVCNPRGYVGYEINPNFDIEKVVEV